jgi:hypothetical protein
MTEEKKKGGAPKRDNTERPDIETRFKKGNKFWEARSSHGRNPKFDDPEKLWSACQEYFLWVHDNPLFEEKLFSHQGNIVRGDSYKMRAMTISGLCIFLDICVNTWGNYKNDPDFLQVTTRAEQVIREQKFTGAAADLLNPNIIARDLGLRDLKSNEVTGPDGGPILFDKIVREIVDPEEPDAKD